jgi:DedD protein
VNTRYEEETDLHELHEPHRDREISLGAATILGIFFVLALICAVFFGFGYTLGRRSAQPQNATVPTEPSEPLSSNSSKPSPGSAAITTPSSTKYATDAPSSSEASETAKTDRHEPLPSPSTRTVALNSTPAKPAVSTALPIKPAPSALAPIPIIALSTPGASIVQVAAVSHQEDADTLLSALKRRGYAVTVRHETQDKLLHVQIGPFATKKDAETIRQRLLSDGYNAIVK